MNEHSRSRSLFVKVSLRQNNYLFPVILIAVTAILFEILNHRFLSLDNIYSIGDDMALVLLLALGGTYVIMQGSFDLSITSILALSGIVTAISYPSLGLSSILLGAGTGLALGALNGFIFVLAKIPSFVVTIGTMMVYSGTAVLVMKGGQSIQILSPNFRWIAIGEFANFHFMFIWAILAAAISIVIFSRTIFGRKSYGIGANVVATDRAGINVSKQRVIAFAVSGFMSGIAGILAVAYTGQSSAGTGSNLLLPAIAAMVIGGNPITGGVGGPHRTVLGALLLAMVTDGLTIVVVPINIQTIIFGMVIILGVALSINRKQLANIR